LVVSECVFGCHLDYCSYQMTRCLREGLIQSS